MTFQIVRWILVCLPVLLRADLPLYWWTPEKGTNFGDELSRVVIERILNLPVERGTLEQSKLLAVGSIIHFAKEGDTLWGSGINGKKMAKEEYLFTHLDVRSVRGPLTREFLKWVGVEAPEIYGDPALLIPRLFPEFKVNPIQDYIIIPHLSDEGFFANDPHVVYSSEPWAEVVRKITQSRFVISTSLHGLIVAEAFGIPARLLKVSSNEPIYKFADYYYGTGRFNFCYAKTLEEAFEMGGESPPVCDLDALIEAFPTDLFE